MDKRDDVFNWDKEDFGARKAFITRVAKGQFGYVRSLNKRQAFDAVTANAMLKVLGALSADNQKKYLSGNVYRVVDITWKLVR